MLGWGKSGGVTNVIDLSFGVSFYIDISTGYAIIPNIISQITCLTQKGVEDVEEKLQSGQQWHNG